MGSRPQRRRPLRATTEWRVLYSHVGWRLQVTSTLAFKADFRPWVCSTHPGRLCLVGARRSHGPSTDDVLESNIGRTTDHWQGKTDHWRRENTDHPQQQPPPFAGSKNNKNPKTKTRLGKERRGHGTGGTTTARPPTITLPLIPLLFWADRRLATQLFSV